MARGVGDPGRVLEINRAYEQQARTVRALTQQYRAANREAVSVSSTFGKLNAAVTELGGSFGTMADRILPNWRIVFTASVAGAVIALGKLTTSAAKSLDNLDDMASATGNTTEKIQALQLVAAKTGEEGFENINKALERTTKAMGEAQIAAEKANNVIFASTGKARDMSDPFKAVGLDPADFKNSIDLLEAWATRVDAIREPAIRAAIAFDLLGKGWARQLPILKNLREEMRIAEEQIRRGGGFTSQESIEATNKFIEVLARLEALFGRIRDQAGAQLGAALTPAIQTLTQFIEENIGSIVLWIRNAAGYIKALADDLIRFFALGLPGQQTEFGRDIINAFIYIQNTLIPGLTAAFNTVMGVLDKVAAGINAIFGTNLSGTDVGIALVIGQVTGAFGLLTTAITTLIPVVTGLVALFGPEAAIVVGLTAVNALIISMSDNWKALGDAIVSAGQQIRDGLAGAWDWLKKIGGQIAGMPAPAGGVGRPMAAGGLVPGSGNRDSFPAWLMPGEFVIRKSIVSALGADFFAGLNRGMGSLLPRNQFATGGLVVAEPAGGGTPVHLHIGGGSFPLNGAPSVVAALVVEAHRQHVRSAGVKPSWYGGR